jgi:hypothetical protein
MGFSFLDDDFNSQYDAAQMMRPSNRLIVRWE